MEMMMWNVKMILNRPYSVILENASGLGLPVGKCAILYASAIKVHWKENSSNIRWYQLQYAF